MVLIMLTYIDQDEVVFRTLCRGVMSSMFFSADWHVTNVTVDAIFSKQSI